MSYGYIYYNSGEKCLTNLKRSILSLKKYTSYPIAILSTNCDHNKINIEDVKVIDIEDCGIDNVLANKCYLNKYTPFDRSIYLDSDTIVISCIDELFGLHGFNVTQFANQYFGDSCIVGRIISMKSIYKDILSVKYKKMPSVNTGVMVFDKHSSVFDVWQDNAQKVHKSNLSNVRHFNYLFDELILIGMMPYVKNIKVISNIYNCSASLGCIDDSLAKVIHYHSSNENTWKEKYKKLYYEQEVQ